MQHCLSPGTGHYFKEFKNERIGINDADVWILKASFPDDARLDYKIVLDKKNWILDQISMTS